jgi:hypothetical protein
MQTLSFDLSSTSTAEAMLTALLVDKHLRVLGPGMHGDMRYDTNRATILVDADHVVERAHFG